MSLWPRKISRPDVDEYGRSALWKAASKGDIASVKSELAAGVDPSAADDAGYTPLHIAVQERQVEVIALLLQHGADPNRADKHGNGPLWTAVYWACRRDHTDQNIEAIRLLLNSGANPDQKNRAAKSPRDFAATAGGGSVAALFRGQT